MFVARAATEALLMLNNFKIQDPKSWVDIARELEKESDPDKVCALSKKLMAAIDTQLGPPPKKRPHTVKLDSKSINSGDC
jgi:hypothetical protein